MAVAAIERQRPATSTEVPSSFPHWKLLRPQLENLTVKAASSSDRLPAVPAVPCRPQPHICHAPGTPVAPLGSRYVEHALPDPVAVPCRKLVEEHVSVKKTLRICYDRLQTTNEHNLDCVSHYNYSIVASKALHF